jgi:MoaA/NifB/PqqE/SkfB family radical SAM enzyme
MLKRVLNQATHHLFEVPVLVLMPHSRCNCRCVMCDIWKNNRDKTEISAEELERHIDAFRKLRVQRVALSGGEALLHPNLWRLCKLLRSIGIRISLLSTGLTLAKHAKEITTYCDEVIVSLDGSPEVHNLIRNIPNAFEKLAEGVRELQKQAPDFRVTGRTVIQKLNHLDLPAVLTTAEQLGLNQISFLAADVSSPAFNRQIPWSEERQADVMLNDEEINQLEHVLSGLFEEFASLFETGFIAESKEKLFDVVRHYRALSGKGKFPVRKCNAPWVSAVIESNGDVQPCFFHKPYGNLKGKTFDEILNSNNARLFRRNLNVKKDPVCQRCVCSLYIGPMQSV